MRKLQIRLLKRCVAFGSAALLVACTHVASLRVYPDDVPPGSLRLVQVMLLGTRSDILGVKEWHAALLASGIADADIQDGSMAVGRIWCCGGPSEMPDRQAFYIPPGLKMAPLDIVEIRAGREPTSGRAGQVNVATRVVQRAGDTRTDCRWEPQNPKLWMRVLYCDWMPREGWVEFETVLKHAWFKPPGDRAAPGP